MLHLTDTVLPPQDIMLEVRKFISITTARNSQSSNTLEVTRTALGLLKNVPATREAVLEYFCSVFFAAVNKHMRQIEMRQNVPISEENIISEIHLVLSSFINGNPEAWAPIISAWSLDLLGKLSTNHSKHINLSGSAGINDCLQQWMSCRATRTLIDITAQCLQCLMHADTESCIKALLDTSVMHSPHFDWVVAHVGSCFPNVVITRVLSCGLKDFCALKNSERKDKKMDQKLNSVVGILTHLAGSHFYDIRTALLDLFMWSLDENVNVNEDTKVQRLATVPFLLNLASLSSMLLKALTNDLSQILTPDVIPRLALFSTDWVKYFKNDATSLINIAVHLALGCDQGALQIINILLDTSLNPSNVGYHSVNAAQNAKNVCREILELILEEIELTIRTDHCRSTNIPLLTSIKQDLPTVIPLLLNSQPLKVKTAVKLLSLLGNQNSNVLISAATYVLHKAQTNFHLAVLVRLITDNANFFSKKYKNENAILDYGYFTQVVEQAIREVQYSNVTDNQAIRQLFQNLTVLLKWENSGKVPNLKSNFITRAIRVNLLQMAICLMKTNNFDLASDIAELLNCLNPPDSTNFPANVELTLRLTKAIIRYFFICIAEDDIIKKQRGVKIVCRFLKGLTTYSQYARVLALREILEIAIFGDPAKYFGAKEKFKFNATEVLLLQQNHKQGTGAILAQRHSSVFHAGIIGQGPRKLAPDNNIDKEIIKLNNTLLTDVIKACCSNRDSAQYLVNIDALTLVSLLLVELISPDVMYNGLPWPDEEFTKVTVERDLQIRRSFKDAPVLWTLLHLTAWYRPTLAYCSVLLRAIVATVLANWNLNKGVMITNVMALGQLLPPPLTTITDVLPVFEPHQITTVMRECVWMYMHENIPSPMLFTRSEGASIAWRDTDTSTPNIRFTETLRLIFLANIHILGSLYSNIFFNEHK
ncbi:integrator complex subunit 5 [Nasonia vitripennis]|uniref:Integrator complex subunit 5 n=1 Tax=Nasonia vitripennis TaxID=7425 RepID=A0A7M7H6A3_NASVI|nr:integrator complex subunit 5 [Nasonia vitripennis]